MDFQLYSLGAALVFHEIFFPESSTAMALILAMGTYGAGYVARIVLMGFSSEPSEVIQQGITGKELSIFSSRLR